MSAASGRSSGDAPATEPEPESALGAAEVRLRAVRGVLSLAFREVLLRGMGLIGNVVIARLLAPRQFGIVAFGYTLIMFSSFISDGGIGTKLIQRAEPPTRAELRALQGLTMLVCLVCCALITGIGVMFGTAGQVAAAMSLVVPLAAISAPATIIAERRIMYSPIVRSDVLQTLSYNIIAISLVAFGFGVWGLTIGLDVSVALGSLLLLAFVPDGWVRPGGDFRLIRPVLRYGLQFQAVGLVSLLRDQGLNVLTTVIAGLPVLGIWSLTSRILQGITLIFMSLWRVSFPAVARLIDAGEDPTPSMRKALSLATTVTGFAAIVVGGTAPALVPLAFGHRWMDVVPVLPWMAAGLMFSGPLSLAASSLLFAKSDTRTMLLSVVLQSIAWFAVSAALLHALGAEAIGIGSCAAALVDIVYLSRALSRLGVPVLRFTVVPVVLSYQASALAWLVATQMHPVPVAFVMAALVGFADYLITLRLLARDTLADLVGLVATALHRTPAPVATG